jgi:hypothetical protein
MSDEADSVTLAPNRFTADSSRLRERLRAIAEEIPADPEETQMLTPMQVRLARHTPIEALERAANFIAAAPGMTLGIDVDELRDVIAFELAYNGVRTEAEALARHVDHTILRRKMRAVKQVRALYRVAKAYVTLDVGDPLRTLVEALKQTLVRPAKRRKKKQAAE